jgi:Fic family protein
MGIIAKIFGRQEFNAKSGVALKTIAAVEEALRSLADERREAQAAIKAALGKRRELLHVDGSNKEIAKLDIETDAHRLTLERCDIIEPTLLARIEELRTDERRARWQELRRRHDAAESAFIKAMHDACSARDHLIAISDEANATGFYSEAIHVFIPPPSMLDTDLMNRFESEAERVREASRPAPMAPAPERPSKVIKPAAIQTPIDNVDGAMNAEA